MVRTILLGLLIVLNAARAENPAALARISPDGNNAATLAASLLPPRLAASLLGGTVTADPDRFTHGSRPGCKVSEVTYSASGTDGPSINFLVRHAASVAENKLVYETALSTKQGVPVPGFGDEAFLTTEHALHIRSGLDWLIITAGTLQRPDLATQEEVGMAVLRALRP